MVVDGARGEDLEPLEERLGLRAAVRLDVADDHVDAVRALLARRLEHGVGLAHARRGAEEHLELAALLTRLLLLDPGEQGVGVGPRRVHAPSVTPVERDASKEGDESSPLLELERHPVAPEPLRHQPEHRDDHDHLENAAEPSVRDGDLDEGEESHQQQSDGVEDSPGRFLVDPRLHGCLLLHIGGPEEVKPP